MKTASTVLRRTFKSGGAQPLSAEQGDAAAQSNLGSLYYTGSGVERDDALAFQWFSRSAEQDFPAGVYHLADCYASGRGTATDIARAAEALRRPPGWGMRTPCSSLASGIGTGRASAPTRASAILAGRPPTRGVKEAAACLRALSGKAPERAEKKRGGAFPKALRQRRLISVKP